MSSTYNKMWFSFAENDSYIGNEPNFFDITSQPWFSKLELEFPSIKLEFQKANKEIFIPYYNKTFASKAENWRIIPLVFWRKPKTKNLSHFPTTQAIIRQIPSIVSCAFSKLEPNTSIKPHIGDSNVMYRVHLPLIVPASQPECGFKVKEEEVSWEEGKPIAFCDAHLHEAWNQTDSERIILILDIIRPEYESKTDLIAAKMQNALFFQFLLQKTPILHHTPRFIRKLMMNIPLLLSYPYVLIQKSRFFR